MAEDTSTLLKNKATDMQVAPTLERKEEDDKEREQELDLDLEQGKTKEPKQETQREKEQEQAKEPEQKKGLAGISEEETKKVPASTAGGQTSNTKEQKVAQKVILTERIKAGRYKAVFKVIKEGKLPANLLIDEANRWYLIHFLVMHNKLTELKVLVDKFDCDINTEDAYGQTALHMAALHAKKEILKYLTQRPLVQIEKFDKYQATPLTNAIKSCFIHGVIYLHYGMGANIVLTDNQGFTSVHWAAFKNTVPLLQLFRHIPQLNFNATDNEGMTPVFRAITGQSYDSVKYLVRVQKADLLLKSMRNQTPYEYATSTETHPKIVSYIDKYTHYQTWHREGLRSLFSRSLSFKLLGMLLKYLALVHGKKIGLSCLAAVYSFLLLTFIRQPHFGVLTTLAFISSYIGSLGFLGWLFMAPDPGYQLTKDHEDPNNVVSELLDQIRNDKWVSYERLCFSCMIKQKDSTQHCFTCNRCVAGYQFHLSPLRLGFCIGTHNFPTYFLYCLLSLLSWHFYINAVLYSALPVTTTPFPVSLVECWLQLFAQRLIVSLVVVILAAYSVELWYEIAIMFYGILNGMTVYEMRHMHLYKYLFDVKDLNEQGLRYVHKKRTIRERLGNLLRFLGSFCGTFRGEVQDIELQSVPVTDIDTSIRA